MEKWKFLAQITLYDRPQAITAGFRPTLSFTGKKALCNIESVQPSPLAPGASGKALFTLVWDWPEACPVQIGTSFDMLEAERKAGNGIVTDIL
jgi:GTPase